MTLQRLNAPSPISSPRSSRSSRLPLLGGLALLLAAPHFAQAQVTLKPDGQWRALVTAGLNLNSGNTRTSALNLAVDSVRATESSKWSATAQGLYATNAGQTTGERAAVSTQYNGDIEPWRQTFAFVQAAGVRDRPANLNERISASTGLGLHLMRQDQAFWDVWAGVGASYERYARPVDIHGTLRDRKADSVLVLAQESSLRLTANTRLRQKLVVLPSLRDSKRTLTEFDAELLVAMSERISLNTGLRLRHTTQPGLGLRSTDTALITGLAMRFD